ncbi:MAG: RagB/SusD family nutrient uptake outer membrane protein [Weeksellaceae bacterium]|nr:RagB/SusD family nutrient uptake outer membrane protein [Bacteroidota bacterium]MCG2779538.1 RagB/SusD family nutrient uptake outer membrane protein [Weeksellaceae bacterium]
MKFKNIFIATTVTVSALTSCSDSFLTDLPPSATIITPTGALKTKTDLAVAVNGLYATMNSAAAFGSNHQTYQELTGDLAFVGAVNSGRFTQTNGWGHISPADGVSDGLWNSLYNIIANANFILGYEGQIPEDENGTAPVADLFAHAHAVRAYSYSVLMAYFAPNYGEGDQSLGVPYPTTFDITQKLPRSTVSQVYNAIINDLNIANANFDPGFSSGKNKFNSEASQLLTARVYLYMKNYPMAIQYANEALSGPTPLLPKNKLSSYFLGDDDTNETLFQIYESPNVNIGANDAISGTWSSAGTYKQNWMRRSFWDTFPITDVRKTFWYTSSGFVNNLTDTPKPIDVRKYTSPAKDVVLFRKTEAEFILFEANYHQNPAQAAAGLQNWVREYRDAAYTVPAVSGQALLDEILRQKGFEFFLEGHRLTDLKRNHKKVDKSGQNGNTFVAEADNYKFVWPIPLSEIQTNPNVVQNPGY